MVQVEEVRIGHSPRCRVVGEAPSGLCVGPPACDFNIVTVILNNIYNNIRNDDLNKLTKDQLVYKLRLIRAEIKLGLAIDREE